MNLWNTIEELKKEQGWTDLDIALKLGRRSHSYLSNLRQGKSPSPAVATKLIDLLVAQKKIGADQRERLILELLGVAA